MQSKRLTRHQSVNIDQNDENRESARMTRAKSGTSFAVSKDAADAKAVTRPLQSKNGAALNRKRGNALQDVSNLGTTRQVESTTTNGIEIIKKTTSTITTSKKVLGPKPNGITKPQQHGRSKSVQVSSIAEDVKSKLGSGATAARKKRNNSSVSSTGVLGLKNITDDENLSITSNEHTVKRAKTDTSKIKIDEALVQPLVAKAQPKEIPHDDLDKDDSDDPLMVAEYVTEIFEYLKQLETTTQPSPDYMDQQEELEWKMRGILVDWLIEVHLRFHLLPETLFLAVNIIDRFLSMKCVALDKLQLVGVTAMFIASKYEEVFSPSIQNFIYVADSGYTEDEVLRAERFVLGALDYNLSYPNPMNFLRRISKADQYDIRTRTLGKYLLEVSLLEHRLISFAPSQLAAASMYLSRAILDSGEWDRNLQHYSGYQEEELMPILRIMVEYLAQPVKHEAFFKKYASKKFLKASIVARGWAKQNINLYGSSTDYFDEDSKGSETF